MLSFLFLLLPLLLPLFYVYTPPSSSSDGHDPSKADQWRDDIFPYRPQTPWNISNSAFTYSRVLTYSVTEGTWLHLDVHPISSDILFGMVGTLFCLPLTGGIAVPLFPPGQIPFDAEPRFSLDGSQLLFRSDDGLGVDNIWIIPFSGCTEHQRSTATRVTNETFRYVSAARFHPSSRSIVATKWYTATVTIGGPEAWLYEIAEGPREGKRLVGRVESKKKEDYGLSQIGPEQTLWASQDTLIYLRNVRDEFQIDNAGSGVFDVHKGTLGMFMKNLTTGVEETLVAAGANRPELSRDGRSLAYVRRDRDHEVLLIKDLITGTIHQIYDDLTYDAAVISSLQGSYPSYAFTPTDDAIIIWYSGQIYRVPLSVNIVGERVASTSPTLIPFKATLTKPLADTRKARLDLREVELKEKQKVHAMRALRIDDSTSYAVLDAGGVTVLQSLSSSSSSTPVPVLHPSDPYYTPSFLPASTHVIHARWNDANYTSFEIASATEAREVQGIPKGRYHSPAVSLDHRKMVFVKTAGDVLTGYTKNTAKPGLYTFELESQNLTFIPSSISLGLGPTQMRFLSESVVLIQQRNRAFTIDLQTGKEEIRGRGKLSNEVIVADQTGYKAFLEYHHVYVTRGRESTLPLWAKPHRQTPGLARTSYYGGHDLTWSQDGQTLLWMLGPTIHSVHVPTLYDICSKEIEQDDLTFGIECVHKLVKIVDVDARFNSFQESKNPRNLLIVNATLLTMHTGSLHQDLIKNGSMLISPYGVILSISPSSLLSYGPYDVLDVEGGYILPGFIDMHAHWGGYTSIYPASSWEMRAFLAYGVTTLHNPSSDTTTTSLERIRLQRGFSIGPRILTTGTVLFGSSWVGLHEEIVDMQQAREALMRIKLEMGEVALSYKNYQLPSRASRQRLLLVAQELGMACVPEGGGNLDWDITYILDGMTTVEHALPIPVLYNDIKILWAASGTGSTPTHIVSYGGAWGEHIVWAEENLPFDDKLREYLPHNILEGISESYARPQNSYAIKNTSMSTAQMIHEGGLRAHIGAHGEQPMGLNYHAEMQFTLQGGVSKYEVLKAATIWPAQTLGLDEAVGSLSEGKMAEFIVFQPGVDLLRDGGGMQETREIRYVSKGGKIWNPKKGMEEAWPEKGKRKTMPDMNP